MPTPASCHIARLPSTTAPGTIALKLEDSEQSPPMPELDVATHGTVIGNWMSSVVAGSVPEGPLLRSVIRALGLSWTSPV